MRPIARSILISFALTAGALTSACDTLDNLEFWDAKKKLPGERRPVFPEGVPGVSQGIPPELVRGYQEPTPQPEASAAPQGEPAATGATGATGAEKRAEPPKPKPKPVARPKPKPAPAEQQAEAPAPQPAAQPPGSTLKPWPSAQPQQQPQAAWPTAPSSGRFER